MDRLTKRSEGGKIMLDRSMFPDYAEETLQREMKAFPPFMKVVEKLCEYEDTVNSTESEK